MRYIISLFILRRKKIMIDCKLFYPAWAFDHNFWPLTLKENQIRFLVTFCPWFEYKAVTRKCLEYCSRDQHIFEHASSFGTLRYSVRRIIIVSRSRSPVIGMSFASRCLSLAYISLLITRVVPRVTWHCVLVNFGFSLMWWRQKNFQTRHFIKL